jgi:MerC mercury resistance protein
MNFKINWDALGISASIACAIHCALLPLVFTSLPLFGVDIIENIAFEYGMIILALVVGIYSLYHGYKKHHHNILPIALFVAGIGFLFAKQAWHDLQFYFLAPALILIVVGITSIIVFAGYTITPIKKTATIKGFSQIS